VSDVIEKQPGVVKIDFKLEPSEGIRGVVLTPDGARASGAHVTLATISNEVRVDAGHLIFGGSAGVLATAAYTDADGAFTLAPEIDPGTIVVAHPAGCAEISSAQFRSGEHIRLRPWGAVRGRLDVPRTDRDDLLVVVSSSRPDGDAPYVYHMGALRPEKDGTFQHDRLAPGRTGVGVHVAAGPGGYGIPVTGTFANVEVLPGETAELALGGRGRPVIGRITADGNLPGAVDFSKVKLRLVLEAPHVGFPGDDAMWKAYGEFLQGERGKAFQRDFTPAADGTFRLDNVPQGRYQLIGPVRYASRVVVEPMPLGASDEPMNLGDIPLSGALPTKPDGDSPAGELNDAQIAQIDPEMAKKLEQRDALRRDLARARERLAGRHPTVARIEKALKDSEADVAAYGKAYRERLKAQEAKRTDLYYVGGRVPRPGVYQLNGRKVNLLQALVAAGFDPTKDGDHDVQLLRRKAGEDREAVTSLSIKDLLEHREKDQFLQADDLLLVKPPPEKPGAAAPAEKRSALLVTEGGNPFLEKALRALDAGVDLTVLRPAAYTPEGAAAYDVVVFDRVAPEPLPAGGRFLFIGSCPPVMQNLGDGPATVATDVGVIRWEKDHPVLRGVDLDRVYIAKAPHIVARNDTEVLAESGTDRRVPLVVLHREAGRTCLVVPFDVLQSNWPLKVGFPIFIHQAFTYLAADGR
jgi:hypothetical protein